MAAAPPMAAAQTQQQDTRYPFLWGTQEQRVPVASIPFVAGGVKAATVRVPKNGYLLKLLFRFNGAANVTVAGSAGTPTLENLISSYLLSYNGGFQYRNMDAESMVVAYNGRSPYLVAATAAGPPVTNGDPYSSSANYKNYNPASATNQTIGFVLEDDIGVNRQLNADKFLLAAQARNADITLDITFGANSTIVANTETVTFSGTLFVDGLYLLDPDYSKFKGPNLNEVQQIVTDTSYTAVVVGDNTVVVVPINGPRYLQLYFKGQFNGVADTLGFSTAITRVQLKINNGLNRYDMPSMSLYQENVRDTGRAIPYGKQGWYCMDFLSDISILNAVSAVGRNVISTEKIAQFWLIVTVAQGTNLTANNLIKLIKRVRMPAA